MRRCAPLLSAALLLGGCRGPARDVAGPAAGALSVPTAHQAALALDRDVTLEITNACTGEVILFTGRIHEEFHTTFDAAGGFRLSVHLNPQGLTGTGKDGTVYDAVGAFNETVLSAASSTEVHTVVSVLDVVARGGGASFRMNEVHHITVNSDGTVTAVTDKATSSC